MSVFLNGVRSVALAGLGLWVVSARAERARAKEPAAGVLGGVAVVELFTSQGCSSCPPAEQVLAGLNAASQRSRRPVYTLAFHVDYWDHLGWRDPFSDARFSARQYDYARTLQLDQVYTPQMIVNGRTQFVGSDAATATHAVDAALATAASTPVTLSAVANPSGGGRRIQFAISGVTDGRVACVAVVEQGLSTEVKRGENADRHLDQPSVVRWFTTVPATAAGEVDVPALPDVQADHATVVAFVQRSSDGAISGAAAVELPVGNPSPR